MTGEDEIVIQGDVTDDIIDYIQEKWPEVSLLTVNYIIIYIALFPGLIPSFSMLHTLKRLGRLGTRLVNNEFFYYTCR